MPIYEQEYERYEGPRLHRCRWWSIARFTAQRVLKKPSARRILLFMLATLVLVAAGLLLADATGTGPQFLANLQQFVHRERESSLSPRVVIIVIFLRYAMVLSFLLWLMTALAGAGTVFSDKASGYIQLLMARPLRRRDYLVGKILGLMGIPTLVAGGTLVAAFVLLWARFLSWPLAAACLAAVLAILAYLVLLGVLYGFSMIAFSCAVRSVREAVAAFVVYWWFLDRLGVSKLGQSLGEFSLLLSPRIVLDIFMVRLLGCEPGLVFGRAIPYAWESAPGWLLFGGLGLHVAAYGFLCREYFRRVR